MNEKTFHTFVKGEKIPILVYNDKNTFSPASVIIFIITTRPKYTSTKQIIPISYLTRCVYSVQHILFVLFCHTNDTFHWKSIVHRVVIFVHFTSNEYFKGVVIDISNDIMKKPMIYLDEKMKNNITLNRTLWRSTSANLNIGSSTKVDVCYF